MNDRHGPKQTFSSARTNPPQRNSPPLIGAVPAYRFDRLSAMIALASGQIEEVQFTAWLRCIQIKVPNESHYSSL
jgi:hypothetical protein